MKTSKALITDDRYQACGYIIGDNKPCSTSPSTCKDCILKKRSTCSFECGQMSLHQESKLPSYREIQSFWNVTSSELYHTKVLHTEEDKCIRAMSPKRILFKVSGDATPGLAFETSHNQNHKPEDCGTSVLEMEDPTNPKHYIHVEDASSVTVGTIKQPIDVVSVSNTGDDLNITHAKQFIDSLDRVWLAQQCSWIQCLWARLMVRCNGWKRRP